MIISVEKYLETLLSFVPQKRGARHVGDYVSLIHVPAHGPERVYSLSFDTRQPVLTVANYRETVWQALERSKEEGVEVRPELDALQASVDSDHPVFDYLDGETLGACHNASDGRPGLDYYLMLWQKDGAANVVECWEPYAREEQAWLTVIGALQTLASQFEYATTR